ncbi:MAG TPA: nitroreductase family protein [Acidimicrobiales bacterium]|nr:nitroreductase family protein [Acidimicrobiales bacterium]
MDGLFDVVHRQRACRAFAADAVDDATVERILEAATFAPSAENRQPWVFVVVRDPDSRAEIGALTRRAWEEGARAHSEGRLTPGLLAEVEAGARGGVASAPVLVVVGGDTRLGDPRVLEASIFPCVQNLLLAATALGLGSSLTTLPLVFGRELSDAVGLPAEVRAMAVVPLGWPARPLSPPRRLPVAAKAHRERFGRPWAPPGPA